MKTPLQATHAKQQTPSLLIMLVPSCAYRSESGTWKTKHLLDRLQWRDDLLGYPTHITRWPPKWCFHVGLGGGMVATGVPPPVLGGISWG